MMLVHKIMVQVLSWVLMCREDTEYPDGAPYWEVLHVLLPSVCFRIHPVEWMTLPAVWLGVGLSGLKLCHLVWGTEHTSRGKLNALTWV